MASAQNCHELTSYYEKKYKEKYDVAAVVNRNDARWKFDAILNGRSVKEVKELMDYWFSVASNQRHPLVWFFYNYDKLIVLKTEQAEDEAMRAKQRKETKERANLWRKRREEMERNQCQE